MFRKTDQQRSLLECEFLVPPVKAERLRRSWAEPFRQKVLPLIDEEVFRDAFSETTGRPNNSIRLMLCLHLLKEWNDLTDEQVLEQLEFNLQWHYALGITAEEAHTCQKSLHNFRVLLLKCDRARREFERVTRALAEADRLSLDRQRLDSTHILPNITVLTRLGLFVETVTSFLKELRAKAPEKLASLDGGYVRRYLEREGYFSDAKREQARRRLPVVATDIYALVRAFELDVKVSALESYQLLERLFDEQCEVVTDDDEQGGDDEGGAIGGGRLRVKVSEPKEVGSDSLQSPHDPDATYGHKGKGYEAQVSETCGQENPYQVITSTMVNGAHESDQKAVKPMLDRLEQSAMMPKEVVADTNYGSGENIVASAKRGVDLQAPVPNPSAPPPTEYFAAPVTDDFAPAAPEEPEQATPSSSERQEHDETLGLEAFTFDPTYHEVLRCAAGKEPASQHLANGQLIATFSAEHCGSCPERSHCPTRLLSSGDRQLRRSPANIATEVRQAAQQTAAFKDRYRIRSGIESTNEELKDRHGLGTLRIRGKPKVELSVTLKALALNVKRAVQHHVCLLTNPAPSACAR